MRFSTRCLLLLLIVCFLGIDAFATDRWQVDIPFSFEAKGKSFPAGAYDITVNVEQGFVTVSNYLHPNQRLQWLTKSSDASPQSATLEFGEDGQNFELFAVNAGKWTNVRSANSPHYVVTASIYDNAHKNLALGHGR